MAVGVATAFALGQTLCNVYARIWDQPFPTIHPLSDCVARKSTLTQVSSLTDYHIDNIIINIKITAC